MKATILLTFFILIMAGCSQNNEREQLNNDEPLPQGVSVKDSHINLNKGTNMSDDERAQYLADLVSGIPNVNDSTVVVLGNLAVVGIDIDGNVERSKVGTIKYSVNESLKHDPVGAGAVVVADPDLNERLKEIKQDMNAGKPLQGIMNELSDIVGRVIPDVPVPEGANDSDDSLDSEKNDMNRNNSRELENEQEEQSYDKK